MRVFRVYCSSVGVSLLAFLFFRRDLFEGLVPFGEGPDAGQVVSFVVRRWALSS